MKDGEPCGKKKCLKETNPDAENPEFRGHYLGTPFVYEECWYSCYLCCREKPDGDEVLYFSQIS